MTEVHHSLFLAFVSTFAELLNKKAAQTKSLLLAIRVMFMSTIKLFPYEAKDVRSMHSSRAEAQCSRIVARVSKDFFPNAAGTETKDLRGSEGTRVDSNRMSKRLRQLIVDVDAE